MKLHELMAVLARLMAEGHQDAEVFVELDEDVRPDEQLDVVGAGIEDGAVALELRR